jgi:hypothetical protein
VFPPTSGQKRRERGKCQTFANRLKLKKTGSSETSVKTLKPTYCKNCWIHFLSDLCVIEREFCGCQRIPLSKIGNNSLKTLLTWQASFSLRSVLYQK